MTTTMVPVEERARGWRVLARDAKDLYAVGFAATAADVAAAQELRYRVFNLELGEGLASAHLTGRDADEFDAVCDHLLVRETKSGELVGTYRLQHGLTALGHLDFYSAREFDLSPFENVRHETAELGRACVAPAHRNMRVLALLWRGIARYARQSRIRYLLGCSSLHSPDPAAGLALYAELAGKYLAPPAFRTEPLPACACTGLPTVAPKVPRLLHAYLSFGAKICGAPALDREFGTVDFLTLLDMQQLDPTAARLYLGDDWQPA